MCERDGVTAYQGLAQGSEARIPTVYPWLLWFVQGVICADGMVAPRTIVKHGAMKQKTGKRKGARSLGIGRLDIVRTSGDQVSINLPVGTEGPAERTVRRVVFRREVKDPASFRCLGSVEPAAERARELAIGVKSVHGTNV